MQVIPLGTIGETGPIRAPYIRNSSTSREAAERIKPHLSEQEWRVMHAFNFNRSCGLDGLTDEECQQLIDLAPSSQRPRRIALVRAGRLADSGLTRKTSSGRSAVIWRAV